MKPPMTRTELESDLLLDAKDYRDMARWLLPWARQATFACDDCGWYAEWQKARDIGQECPNGNCGIPKVRDWLEGAE